MLKESAMEKWFKFEIARINSGIVTKKKSLSELIEKKNPSCQAKDESIYYFNKEALCRLKNEQPTFEKCGYHHSKTAPCIPPLLVNIRILPFITIEFYKCVLLKIKHIRPRAHTFENGGILRFSADELPDEMHSVMLPITFYTDFEVRGSVYVAEKPSLSVLKHLEEVPEDAALMDGRYWMSKALVLDIMKRWPTIIQFVRY